MAHARGKTGIQIRLLGELEVRLSGEKLPLPSSRKARALLAYLLASDRPHSRSQLCELFWDVPDDPKAALRWCLSKIRPLVDQGRKRLLAERNEVAIDTADLEIDLLQIRKAMRDGVETLETARLEHLDALFNGGFLDGLELVDCYRFHAFWVGQREAMQQAQVAILSLLVTRHQHAPSPALEFARKLAERDPLSEIAHLQVIQILGSLGRTRDALKQYETCTRIFNNELQTRPSAQIERARLALTAAKPEGALAENRRDEPLREVQQKELIGRERERGQLRSFVAEHMPCVLISGEAGMGKSRLLEDLSKRFVADGGVVQYGRAFEAEMIRPYGAWIDALGEARWAQVSEQGATDRAHLFEAVSLVLSKLTSNHKLLLAFDDVQWFDDASLALLHMLVRSHPQRGEKLFVVLSARPDELEDNPQAHKTIRGLLREKLCQTLLLEPIAAEAVRAWMQPMLSREAAERVARRSAGVPLYAIELARAAGEGNEVPDTLHRLIGERLSHLSERGREVAGWAAALGRNFDFEIMRSLSSMSAEELVEALETLDRRGFIKPREGGYDFVHDLFRTSAYRALSEPRRRLMHLRIARALFAAAQARKQAELMGDVAHHAQLAGDDELAATACVAAGERCLKLFAFEEGTALAMRGLRAIGKLPDATRLRLKIELVRLLIRPNLEMKELQRWDSELVSAIEEARSLALHEVVAAGCHARIFSTYWLGEWGDAFAQSIALSRVEPLVSGLESARHYASTAACFAQLGREIPRALALVQQAEQAASEAGQDPYEIAWASGCLAYVQGNLEVGVPLLLRASIMGRSDPNQWPAWDALSKVVRFYIEAGRYADALAHCKELLELESKLGEGSEAPFSRALQAIAQIPEQPAAWQALTTALEQLQKLDANAGYSYCASWAARLAHEKRDLPLARAFAEKSRAAAERVQSQTEIAEARLILAELLVEEGDLAAAEQLLLGLRPLLEQQFSLRMPTERRLRQVLDRFSPPATVKQKKEKADAVHRRRVQA